jgi:ATP-binding cassette, subfamily B, bacterial
MQEIKHPFRLATKIFPFFYKPFVSKMTILLIVGTIYAVIESLVLASAYPLFATLLNQDTSMAAGGHILNFVSEIIRSISPDNYFLVVVSFFAIVVLLKNIIHFIRDYYAFSLGQLVREKYSNHVYKKYIQADMEYILEKKQGEILFNIITAPGYMTILFSRIPITVTEGFKLIAIFILLMSISIQITIGILFIGTLFFLSISKISKKVTFLRAKEIVSSTQETNVLVNESLNGIQQLRIFQAESRWIKAFSRENSKIRKANNKGTFFGNIPNRVIEIVAVFIVCFTLLIIKLLNPEDFEEYLPLTGVFFMAMARILPSLNSIGNDLLQIVGRLPYAKNVFDVLQEKSKKVVDGNNEISNIGEVCFNNVNHIYPSREDQTLKDISFKIEPKSMTALVGASGSGKSTIVNLLVRLINPSSGSIMTNGLPISQLKLNSWLSKIGYVSQETFIFNASVSENISFGKECSQQEIIEAAKLANADEFITTLPDSYNTIVGDRGLKLSGGQRQRIAIARAIIRNPELLILDEATSSLDNMSEAVVQKEIQLLSRKYTVLVVAHRLNTIKNANKIVVLKNGFVVESGTHQQLISNNGEYAQLYKQEESSR